MKNNKNKEANKKINNNKKVKVISITLVILLLILGILSLVYSQNIKLAKSNNEEQDVEESKASKLVLEDNRYMHVEIDESGDKVPVPNGFVGSKVIGENEIDNGYVIYALNEGETKETVEINDTNREDAQKTRNQYVWVPIPDPSTFYGTDANGKKWGKIYDFDMDNDNKTGTVPLDWSESEGVMTIGSSRSNREPDIVIDFNYDIDSRLKKLDLGAETSYDFLIQLEKDFDKMIDSVEKYGGFYIGRYETGNLSQEKSVIRKGNVDIAYKDWYRMYKQCKKIEIENRYVVTGMIWGNQFDRTLMWFIESNTKNPKYGKTKEEVIDTPTSWGNYYSSTFEYTDSSGILSIKNENSFVRIPTGCSEYTKANNIYDLAGNVYEATMEASNSYARNYRGGTCSDLESSILVSDRRATTPDGFTTAPGGCRTTLYIK